MSCEACEAFQGSDQTSYFRWGRANVEVRACAEHLKEVFDTLRAALASAPAPPPTKDDVYKAYRRGHEIGMKDGAEEAQDPAQAAPLASAEKRNKDDDDLLRECEEALRGVDMQEQDTERRINSVLSRLAARREGKAGAAPEGGDGG